MPVRKKIFTLLAYATGMALSGLHADDQVKQDDIEPDKASVSSASPVAQVNEAPTVLNEIDDSSERVGVEQDTHPLPEEADPPAGRAGTPNWHPVH